MWKKTKDGLIEVTDVTRIPFRTNISRLLVEKLQLMAKDNNTHVNYLIENGLENLLTEGVISFNKDLRPKDRIQFKTTYDETLLNQLKEFAKQHKLYINDVIEYSIDFIDINNIKTQEYRHRIE